MTFYKMLVLLESDKRGPSGWLSPSGRLYESEKYMFDHLGIITRTPELRKLMPPEFEIETKRLEGLEKECQAASSSYAPWHDYDSMHDSLEMLAYDEMYKKGYLRVASTNDEVHFEGTPQGLKSLYNKAKDIADQHGKKAYFQRISYEL